MGTSLFSLGRVSIAIWAFAGAFACPAIGQESTESGAAAHFDINVASILAKRCLDCHNRNDKKGGLDLSRRDAAMQGGDSGPPIAPGNPDGSLLWQRVSQNEMPPEHPLPDSERETLNAWLASGATWGEPVIDPFKFSNDQRAGYDWWSLRPLARPAPPDVANGSWPRNDVDRFVLASLEKGGLAPSPEADRRALARRLSFDLLGLPPSPERVAAFVVDESPDAYERLVEELLDSPHYGERWARHWLDVARYGESQGFERDKNRPNSWPYRDWVVQAFNADLPYDEFVRRQVAGDVLYPNDPTAAIATGFLVAGPWDEVGQSQQSLAMRKVVRQDELEDLVGVTCQTFVALTVNCARCHDHKFDPISQLDYYRLSAALGGVRHGERELKPAPLPTEHEMRTKLAALEAALATLEGSAREQILAERRAQAASPVSPAPTPIARWEFLGDLRDELGELHGEAHGDAATIDGRLSLPGGESYVLTAPLAKDLAEKTLEAWVKLTDLQQGGGGVIGVQTLDGATFDAVVFGEREAGRWVPGSNGFVRTQDVGGPQEDVAGERLVHVAITYKADRTVAMYRDGRPYGNPYAASALMTFAAGKSQIAFGLRHSPAGGNRVLRGAIERAQLYDRALTPQEIARSAGVPDETITADDVVARLDRRQREERARLVLEITQRQSQLRLHEISRSYAVAPQPPEECRVLARGDTRLAGDVALPGAVASVARGTLAADFGLAAESTDADRRMKLAEWISSPDNPLVARTIVNRIWHYHFGLGLVDTPNDFGYNGGRPSHPELLDWLASDFIARGWSIKQLHRTIVHSATYRQDSRLRPEGATIDAGNRLLWRKNPVRLEAEELRDALLSVAGKLNPAMGGPGYEEYRTFTFNSQFYEFVDVADEAHHRRSLYRTWIRSGGNPLLDAFDCPDPSTTSPRRAVTTTPLQALALLNHPFALRMSEAFAERLQDEAGGDPRAQAARANRLAFGREAEGVELDRAAAFIVARGLAAYCRAIFNSNEFLYLD